MRATTTDPTDRLADVVVIGAGQAGLSAGHHLRRRGFADAAVGPPDGADDADAQAAWALAEHLGVPRP